MKIGSALITSFIVLLVVAHVSASAYAEPKKAQKFVIQLQTATNNLHSTFMAVKIGRMLTKKKQDVTLFVNLEGVRLVDKRQPLELRWGAGKSELEDVYEDFIDSGGKVIVCPHCAKAVGLSKKYLRKGARIGTEDSISQALIAADKILDY